MINLENVFIKDRIKKYREAKGISQAELALISGISVSNISKYETGNRVPKTDYLIKIADALNVPLSALTSSRDLGEQAFENLLTELNYSYQVVIDSIYGDSEEDIIDFTDNSFLTYKGKHYHLTTEEYEKLQEDVISYTTFLLEKIIKKSNANQKDSDN